MRALTVGLTGGIGAGKSLAARAVARFVDTDEIARDQAKPGGSAYKQIVKAFGKSILNRDRTIDRKKLGDVVFRDAAKRRALEKITHPLVLKEMRRQMKQAKDIVYVAVPLLFEANLEKEFDVTMTIEAPRALRMRRVCRRDGLSPAQVGERMKAQMKERERMARADVVLRNSASKDKFFAEFRGYHRALSLLRSGAAAK
jgi:dephospho-CoA kinase